MLIVLCCSLPNLEDYQLISVKHSDPAMLHLLHFSSFRETSEQQLEELGMMQPASELLLLAPNHQQFTHLYHLLLPLLSMADVFA